MRQFSCFLFFPFYAFAGLIPCCADTVPTKCSLHGAEAFRLPPAVGPTILDKTSSQRQTGLAQQQEESVEHRVARRRPIVAKNNNVQKFVAILAVLARNGVEIELVKYAAGQEEQALRHLEAFDLDGVRAVLVWGPGAEAPTPDYSRYTMWTVWGKDWSATWTSAEAAWKGDEESSWLHDQPDYLFREATKAAKRICLPVKPW